MEPTALAAPNAYIAASEGGHTDALSHNPRDPKPRAGRAGGSMRYLSAGGDMDLRVGSDESESLSGGRRSFFVVRDVNFREDLSLLFSDWGRDRFLLPSKGAISAVYPYGSTIDAAREL